jgi:hypothetical protein
MSYRALFIIGVLIGTGYQLGIYLGYLPSQENLFTDAVNVTLDGESASNGKVSVGRPEAKISKKRTPAAADPDAVNRARTAWRFDLAPADQRPVRATGLGIVQPGARDNLWQASQDFLDQYGEEIFGFDPRRLKVESIRPGTGNNSIMKIVYEQEFDGVPVINSRVAFFYNSDGTLFEVQSNTIPSSQSPVTEPPIGPAEAAGIALAVIQSHYQRQSIPVPALISVSSLSEQGLYALYLEQNGVVTRVYQYVLLLPGLTGSHSGEREIVIDAVMRQVTIDRRVSRN